MDLSVDEPLLQLRLDVGEGPVWDVATNSLLFVDVSPGRIYRYHPSEAELRHFDFGQEVGAAISGKNQMSMRINKTWNYCFTGAVDYFIDSFRGSIG